MRVRVFVLVLVLAPLLRGNALAQVQCNYWHPMDGGVVHVSAARYRFTSVTTHEARLLIVLLLISYVRRLPS